MVIANWVQLHTCMILIVFYLFVSFDAQYWCWVFGWIFFTWWPQKKGGEGALTHTKVIIVWPYLAKSSCGWSSPVHLPTKWEGKKTLMMMMMMVVIMGSAMTKSFIHILFILYRPSEVSMCLFVLVFFLFDLTFSVSGLRQYETPPLVKGSSDPLTD